MLEINKIIDIAKKAGKEVLKIYKDDNIWIDYKADKSPLTLADKVSHEIIKDGLKTISNLNTLSEEDKTIPFEYRKYWEYFWLIDPLDGTKEFINKNGQFTINIALIHLSSPILGVVYAPALDILFFGGKNIGAFKEESGKITDLTLNHLKNENKEKIKIVVSKSHFDKDTQNLLNIISEKYTVETISIGSSLKLCLLAEGKADIYPRLSPTMEWDTAAADAILSSVGGSVLKFNNIQDIYNIKSLDRLEYNKSSLKNPPFVAIRSNDILL